MHMNSWSDNRLKLQTEIIRPLEELPIFSFVPIKAHTYDSTKLKQSAYATVGEDRLLLASLENRDRLKVVLCDDLCNYKFNDNESVTP